MRLIAAALSALLAVSLVPAAAQQAGCPRPSTDITITARGNRFDTECLAAPSGEPLRITLVNQDPFSHNLSIYRERGGEALFVGEYVVREQTVTYEVPALPEGTWYFRCDIHPQMDGQLLSGAGGEAPQPGPTPTVDEGRAPQGPRVRLERVVAGITAPVFITAPRDGTGRLFVVDQIGLVHVVANGQLLETPFLDVRDALVDLNPAYDERGLLGLAFHPQYRQNGRFFVYYTIALREEAPDDWNSTSRISEFRVSETDPNRADDESERVVMHVDQPQRNHNGGHIAFGPDGMLYVPLGDGGAGNDTGVGHSRQGNAQDTSNVLGSILRIDADPEGDRPFGVPGDNPFVNEEGFRPEIWAYGFRNPYHISFDSQSEDLYAADAGQDRFEEVSRVERGGNYGWRIKEGTHCFAPETPSQPPADCPDEGPNGRPLIDPVIEYGREEILGSAVVGGYVYRGNDVPYLRGRYVFGDYSTNRVEPDGVVFAARSRDEDRLWEIRELRVEVAGDEQAQDGREQEGRLNRFVLSFGEDENRELYVGVIERGGPEGMTGAVYRFLAAPDQEGAAGDGGLPLGARIGIGLGALLLTLVITLAARARARGRAAKR